jgi:hypothetical protein
MPKLASATRGTIGYPMSQADADAHQESSHVRPARNASTDRVAVRSRICRDAIAQLSAMDAREMTPGDFDRLAQAKAELAEITAKPAPVDSDQVHTLVSIGGR